MIKDKRERYILTPLDKKSFDELNFGEEPSNYLRLDLSTEEFLCLLKSGVLDEINVRLNVFIDDFEQEVVSESKELSLLLSILDNYGEWHQFALRRLLMEISSQVEKSIENKTGVFFMF